jgi:hypothetical protein
MSTPLPGQIRCPTCHRSTPPAAFCTQCGTAIADSARARPRGLDREELQDRIRTHRPGDAAFRRGSQVGGASELGPLTYRPYQPEPEDELVLPGGAGEEAAPAHIDNTAPDFDQPPPPPPKVDLPPVAAAPVVAEEAPGGPAPVEPPPIVATPALTPPPVSPALDAPLPAEPQPAPWRPAPPPAPVEPFEAAPPQWSADERYLGAEGGDGGDGSGRYRDPRDEWDRRGSGMSPLAIGGFVLLGVLAIAVGAFMAGLFSGGAAVDSPSPTPLPSTSASASLQPSLGPSSGPSAPASLSPSATPVPPPDQFTARAEPCAEQPASQDGCGSSGSTVTNGSVWVWVGWQKGSDADTLGVTIQDTTGATVGTGSLALSSIGASGCGASCNGWARFKFGGLAPGDYTIRVDRNGVQVAQSSFTVNS